MNTLISADNNISWSIVIMTFGDNMSDKTTISNKKGLDQKILDALLEDPTRSMREIARELDSYRQTLWRKKKKMEKDNLIWGYTAVIDEVKQGKVTFLVLMKMKPMMKDLAQTIVHRIKNNEPAST